MGKTTLAEAFAHNYENHNHEVIIFRNGNQIAEKFILDELFVRFENDEKANKNTVRQIKQYLETDANPQDKLQVLIDNYLKNRKTILVFDNFEDVQISVEGEQQQAIGSASLAEFMTYLCQNTPQNCHLLFTTRYKIVDLAEHLTHLALDKMTYAEQYRLTNFSETLRKIPMSERQDIVKRLDGHPRAYEFLESLLKKDKTLTWTKLSTQIGEVEAKVWEDLLLEKIYQRLSPDEQQLLQICAVFISRTPIEALNYVLGKIKIQTVKLEIGGLLGLYFYDVENQAFEVHRLTREWVMKRVINIEDLKEWAFLAGEYFIKENILPIQYVEISREYFKISEKWDKFISISFDLQRHYGIVGFSQRVYELNVEIFNFNFDADTNAAALNNIGHMILGRLRMKEDLGRVLEYFNKSLEIQEDAKNRKGIAVTKSNIAKVYEITRGYKTAMDYLEQSMQIYLEEEYKYGQAMVLDKMSQIHLSTGKSNNAKTLAQKSLQIYEEIEDAKGIGDALNNLGVAFFQEKKYIDCSQNLKKSLEIRRSIGYQEGVAITLSNLAMAYYMGRLGTDDDIIKCLEESLKIQQELGDNRGQATTLLNIGTFYINNQNNFENAIRAYIEVYDINKALGSPNIQNDINRLNQLNKDLGEQKFQAILQKLNRQITWR
jgi:tetratricopeptide (TPR) repeat protein